MNDFPRNDVDQNQNQNQFYFRADVNFKTLTYRETTLSKVSGSKCQKWARVNDPFLGALYPSKSGLMNKHIVKHIGPRLCPKD